MPIEPPFGRWLVLGALVLVLTGCAGLRSGSSEEPGVVIVGPNSQTEPGGADTARSEQRSELTIRFAFESSELDVGSKAQLAALSKVALTDPDSMILVDAHTDNRGWSLGNLELSRQRALSVARLLVDEGVPGNRLQLRAHGESRPIARNTSAEGRAENRRVTLYVR